MRVAFVQPFGIHGPGGGPRILRALLADRPVAALSIATTTSAPPPSPNVPELHLPPRPTFGRVERTRFHRFLGPVAIPLEPVFRRRLRQALAQEGAGCVHLIAHDATFWPAYRAARELGLPVALTVHDHLAYNMRDRPEMTLALRRAGRVWREADHRFVISEAIGDDYGRRFGSRSYDIVTDGLAEVRKPAAAREGRCTVYFMGAFHMSYARNLEALVRGLEIVQQRRPDLDVTLRMRCGDLPGGPPRTTVRLEALPLADERAVERDLEDADALWLPLPFGPEHESFVRYSLSTKLVTYLGSGVPILYHGPPDSAAALLLRDAGAAAEVTSLAPETVAEGVTTALADRLAIAQRAGRLAETDFMLDGLRERFWTSLGRLGSPAERAQQPL